MQTIAILNNKGGVGKSALTVFLADFLSTHHHQRVLVVDLDPQHSSSLAILGRDRVTRHLKNSKKHSLPRLMWESRDVSMEAEVLKAGIASRKAIEGKGNYLFLQQIDVLLGKEEEWPQLDDFIADDEKETGKRNYEHLLKNTFRPLRDDYDFVLIDFPAKSVGPVTRNGIAAADWWLLPAKPIPTEVDALAQTKNLVDQTSKGRRKPMAPLLTILTMHQDRKANTYKEARREFLKLASEKRIPDLADSKCEIAQSIEAINALTTTYGKEKTTLKKKYGSPSALYNSMIRISEEVIDRTAKASGGKLRRGRISLE
ncbi:MAG: ParA family protein [Verrucomicrobiota bacterium]